MYEETRSKGFGDEAKRRIMLGTYALSSGYYDAYYLRGQKVRTLIKNDLDEVFKDCDVIMTPTSPTVAFKVGEKISDPLSMYLVGYLYDSGQFGGYSGDFYPLRIFQKRLADWFAIDGQSF